MGVIGHESLRLLGYAASKHPEAASGSSRESTAMKIGELARAAQCSVETIRYYEKEGLLSAPLRTDGNYRDYGPGHIERLRFIRNCRALDMAQEEIRQLLGWMDHPADDCGVVNRLVDDHIRHVEMRLAELERLRGQLQSLRQSCQARRTVEDCAILQALTHREPQASPLRHHHLG